MLVKSLSIDRNYDVLTFFSKYHLYFIFTKAWGSHFCWHHQNYIKIMYQNTIYICISWYRKFCWFLVKKCWCQQNSRGMSCDSYIFWIFFKAGFELAVHNSQFAKRFGRLQMSFCIFSENYELLKLHTSFIFRVIHWTSYIVGYFKPIKYPLLNNNVISLRFMVHINPN